MGWLSKAWKGIKKGWDEIDEYAVPILGAAAIGALTGGFGVGAIGSLGTAASGTAAAGTAATAAGTAAAAGTATAAASASAFSWTGALIGGGLGALQGYQMGDSKVQAEKQQAAATAAAERQERLANSASTAVTAGQSVSNAEAGQESFAGARKRRYGYSKTTNSGLGLSRYSSATSTSKRTKLG